jgi:uroporphyrinogen decarboxylase
VNSRERVKRTIEMTGPDRVPLTHASLPGAVRRYGTVLERIYAHYPADVAGMGGATSGEYGPEIKVPSRDTWGSLWVRHTDEHKGQVVHCPLRDWDALSTFEPPDTSTEAIIGAVERNTAQNAGDKYSTADGDILWQRMFYLHGYEATLEDLLVAPDRCADLRDIIMAVMMRRVERLSQIPDLDGVTFRDDWGTQQALMISPRLWREFFKPSYARLFEPVRAAGKHVWFHSDGMIDTIIPDLIEIGVQVLNPQVDVMGKECVKALCTGRICIHGDLDRQYTLPYGTPEDVRAAVRADIDTFGRSNGGYIARGQVASDVPLENVEAMYDEIMRYGVYQQTT